MPMSQEEVFENIREMACRIRKRILDLAYSAGKNGAHLGSGLSIVEIMAVLYGGVMRFDPRNPRWDLRDRFILSKGHGSLGYYTALAQAGLISDELLGTFEVNGGILPGQPVMNPDIGIEFSSGSLGHGLSLGIGTALAGRMSSKEYRVYVLMGDGECNEGSVWEAAMAARHLGLSHLVVIVDANGMQSDGPCRDIICVNLDSVWRGFDWHVSRVDGHSVSDLWNALQNPGEPGRPHVIIAQTIKGKGVSFMEGNNEWHHNRLTINQYNEAIAEISSSPG